MAYKDPNDPRLKEARRRHYYKNKQQYLDRNKKSKDICKETIKKAKSKPCEDCGESYPHYVMDFHHLDRKLKNKEVTKLASHGIAKVLEEIEKCIVLCSNCHRERTYKENSGE